MSRKPEPRYIRPEQIHIGDTLRVEAKLLDALVYVVFSVGDRQHVGNTTFWDSLELVAILCGSPGQTHYLALNSLELPVQKITLLKSATENLQTLLEGL